MNLRIPILMVAVASWAFAHAQSQLDISKQLETEIGSALQTMGGQVIIAQHPTLTLNLTETKNLLGTKWQEGDILLLQYDGQGMPLIDVEESRQGNVTKRFVMDGKTLWVYDAVANTYSAFDVNEKAAGNSATALKVSLNSITEHGNENTGYLCRLVESMYGTYSSWIGGVLATPDANTGIDYVLNGQNPRYARFNISGTVGSGYQFDSLDGGNSTKLETDTFTIFPYVGFNINPVQFSFVPPANAQPISFPAEFPTGD